MKEPYVEGLAPTMTPSQAQALVRAQAKHWQAHARVLRRQTERKRMTAKLHELAREMQRRRHQSIPEQGRWLNAMVRGHVAYYGVGRDGSRRPTIAAATYAATDQVPERVSGCAAHCSSSGAQGRKPR